MLVSVFAGMLDIDLHINLYCATLACTNTKRRQEDDAKLCVRQQEFV